jgi:hypothetical protein
MLSGLTCYNFQQRFMKIRQFVQSLLGVTDTWTHTKSWKTGGSSSKLEIGHYAHTV